MGLFWGKSKLKKFVECRDIIRKFVSYPFLPYLLQHRWSVIGGLVALLVVDAVNVMLPLAIKGAIDALGPKDKSAVWWFAIVYLVLVCVQSFGRYLWRMLLVGTSHSIALKLRRDLYQHLQRLPLQYYQRIKTGDLMSRATNDIESVRMAVGPGILVTVDAIFMFLLIVPVMWSLSGKLSLLAFAFYPIVPFLSAWLGEKIDKLFEGIQARLSELGAFSQGVFGGIRLVKSLVMENQVQRDFRAISEKYRIEGVRLARYEASFSPALAFITNLGAFLILLVGGIDVINGAITVGTFVAFQRFVVQLAWPMEAIGWAVTMNREGFAAHRRLNQILHVPKAELTLEGAAPRLSQDYELLDIYNLTFDYGPGQFQLRVGDAAIERGQRIGLVGGVGSGKTTLLNLLLRLYEPPPGTVFWRGQDIRTIPSDVVRRRMGSVEQQVYLFSESVDHNVDMGLDRDLRPEETWNVLSVAAVREEISSLEKSASTLLGERGVNLSGGQKQRLALARALARNPELLLLDDAFSAVDVAVEERIIKNLLEFNPNMAILFASHRLSIMDKMDSVWLMHQGRLIATGTHAELLKTQPLYRDLVAKAHEKPAPTPDVLVPGGAA